ncbi:MAG: methylated-DNA--[protein]-cysteine S-methyltransferase [Nitrospirales bacterium]
MPPAHAVFKTPWGWMGLTASDRGVARLVLPRHSRRAVELVLKAWEQQVDRVNRNGSRGAKAGATGRGGTRPHGQPAGLLRDAQRQVTDFLAGRSRRLNCPLDIKTGSPFQRKVWRTIGRIPFGTLRSYKWVATRVGGARYARAVGLALGANPVPLRLPCHRVIAESGELGGFTGGLAIKRRLLALEGTLSQLRRYGKNG